METLICPVCRGSVESTSSGCYSCHLPISDVRKNQASRSAKWGRAFRVRVSGVVLYSAVVLWCWLQLPAALTFVIPGAVLGGLLHVWRGWRLLGLVVFALVVVVVPALLWPSMLTGTFADLTDGL